MQTMKHKRVLQHAHRTPGALAPVPQPRRADAIGVLGSARAWLAQDYHVALEAIRAAFRRTRTM